MSDFSECSERAPFWIFCLASLSVQGCVREGEERQQQLSHRADGVLWGQCFLAPAKEPKATGFGLLLRQDKGSSPTSAFAMPGLLLFSQRSHLSHTANIDQPTTGRELCFGA